MSYRNHVSHYAHACRHDYAECRADEGSICVRENPRGVFNWVFVTVHRARLLLSRGRFLKSTSRSPNTRVSQIIPRISDLLWGSSSTRSRASWTPCFLACSSSLPFSLPLSLSLSGVDFRLIGFLNVQDAPVRVLLYLLFLTLLSLSAWSTARKDRIWTYRVQFVSQIDMMISHEIFLARFLFNVSDSDSDFVASSLFPSLFV